MKQQTYETLKLYYNSYLYKAEVYFPPAVIFRDKNWSYARGIIDCKLAGREDQEPLYSYLRYNKHPMEEYTIAQQLLKFFTSIEDDFRISICRPVLSFYCKDISLIYKLESIVGKNRLFSIHKPANKYAEKELLENKNIIITEDKNWAYKIVFKESLEVDNRLLDLRKSNKIYFRNNDVAKQINVKDEKTLTLIQLITNCKIDKIYTFKEKV